jgi:acyl-CoA synthetase (AMP-forming)/AMP-acid ligase II/3-hydroxymyristoyl/3-hydroxydecanoyl-(acyl carrier protein) dehydratase
MSDLLETLAGAPSSRPLFFAGRTVITAGQVRATASDIASRLPGGGTIHLHTQSAALFASGLLAAARKACTVCCPAHMQPLYLREIGADLLVTDQSPDFPDTVRAELASDEEEASTAPDAPNLVFYTSGSTGTPKTVAKTFGQLDAEVAALESVWPNGAQHVFATVSHQHIYGMLFRIFWPLSTGGVSADRAAEYWEELSGRLLPGTTLVSGPAHLTRLVAPSAAAPDRLFSSGAPLPFAAAQQAGRELGTMPIEVLGSTETGGIGWRKQDREDALWTPLPHVDVIVDDDNLLAVRSPYAKAREFVLTGDLAEVAGNQFRLKGRADRVVKVDGKRVSLTRVDEALIQHPFITAAAAIDLPARKGALGVVVELNSTGTAALKEMGAFRLSRDLRRALTTRLEPAERPKHWHFGIIPVDQQAKRVHANLRRVFDRPQPDIHGMPLAQGTVKSVTPDAAQIVFKLDPQMIWFDGHFPEQPVLPGIAQVHMAVQWAQHLWNWRPMGGSLSQVKFRRVLRPGDVVELSLSRLASQQRLKFACRLGDIVASEGVIGDFE